MLLGVFLWVNLLVLPAFRGSPLFDGLGDVLLGVGGIGSFVLPLPVFSGPLLSFPWPVFRGPLLAPRGLLFAGPLLSGPVRPLLLPVFRGPLLPWLSLESSLVKFWLVLGPVLLGDVLLLLSLLFPSLFPLFTVPCRLLLVRVIFTLSTEGRTLLLLLLIEDRIVGMTMWTTVGRRTTMSRASTNATVRSLLLGLVAITTVELAVTISVVMGPQVRNVVS